MDNSKLAQANALSADIKNIEAKIEQYKKTCRKQFLPTIEEKTPKPVRCLVVQIGCAEFGTPELYINEEQRTKIVDNTFDAIIGAMEVNKAALEKQFKEFK